MRSYRWLFVLLGKRLAHFCRLGLGGLDLDERTFADAGTIMGGLGPGTFAIDELGPEGKGAALGGLRDVNPAAAFEEEVAGGGAGDAEAHAIAGAVDVLAFEGGGRHSEKCGGAYQVGLGEVDEPLLAAAFRTPGLAFEA